MSVRTWALVAILACGALVTAACSQQTSEPTAPVDAGAAAGDSGSWEETKQETGDAREETEQKTGDAWEETKKKTGDAWDETKRETQEAAADTEEGYEDTEDEAKEKWREATE